MKLVLFTIDSTYTQTFNFPSISKFACYNELSIKGIAARYDLEFITAHPDYPVPLTEPYYYLDGYGSFLGCGDDLGVDFKSILFLHLQTKGDFCP